MATQNESLLLGFRVTDKPHFGSSHRSNIKKIMHISIDRPYRLTANLPYQKHKIQSNIFEKMFEAADH